MKKMLIVIPDISRYAGSERVNVNLANQFSANYDVTILTQNQERETIFFKLNESVNVQNLDVDSKIKSIDSRLGKLKTFFKQKLTFGLIKEHLSNNQYDLVLGMSGFLNWMVAYIGNDSGKVLLCEHRDYKYLPWYFRILQKLTYNKANSTVVLTESQKGQFPKHINNLEIIPNYGQFNLKPNSLNQKVISYIGRLDQEKRVDWLLEAYISNPNLCESYQLKIAGDGDARELLEKKYKHKNISFLGLVSNVEAMWEETEIAVLPSFSEAFPMTILEAMCKGVPFVGFDVPGVRDIIKDNFTGLLIKDESPGALSKELQKLLADRDKMRRLSGNSLKVIAEYTPEAIMKRWDNLICK